MSFYSPYNPMAYHGRSWGPSPSSQSSSSIRDTLSNWSNSARNYVSGLAQGAADRMRPNTSPPGYWMDPSLSSGQQSSGNSSPSNQSSPWSSPTQQPQQSLVPAQSYPTSQGIPPNQTYRTGSESDQPGVKAGMYDDGQRKGYEITFDTTKLSGDQSYKSQVGDGKGNIAFTAILSIDPGGRKQFDVYSGAGPADSNTSMTGPQFQPSQSSNGMIGPSGPKGFTNMTGPTDPSQSSTSEPQIDRMPNFIEMMSDQNPQNWVYGVPPVDLSNIGASKSTTYGEKGSKYSDILFEKGVVDGFDGPRKVLEDTTDWVQNRYHHADWTKQYGVGKLALNRRDAREIASQFLDSDHDGSIYRESQLTDIMDEYVSTGLLPDSNLVYVDSERPTKENGLGSASSLAFDGSKLSDWAINMVGPPEEGYGGYGGGYGSVFSQRQVEKMKDLMDNSQAYGDDLCEAAGFSPEETSLFSSQIGSLLTTEVTSSGRTKPDDDQRRWAYMSLLKAKKVYDNQSDEDKETYNRLASGKLSVEELNSYLQQQQSDSQPSASATSDSAGSTSNATPTNPSVESQLRDQYDNWRRSQYQPQPRPTSSNGMPPFMQTGFNGYNPNASGTGVGSGLNKPSAMKGGRVSFNPGREEQDYWKSLPPSAVSRGSF
ncbi:hypothetical protein I203_108253 [Kwoniella mangroviensis CBS 8507]|uniref:hypothetical protein n=1 Tax=Kwoniella mangroviensis CBS 8507 TaxID=1296122 RepID=UPI00080D2A2E|nr:uncharacterized protein I203_05144 [Kwoniella mangroviensis CBS 8507]OCF65469.1 hypothetical protein I203_05144 [Kwoniella mangroviensis CBS 8507]